MAVAAMPMGMSIPVVGMVVAVIVAVRVIVGVRYGAHRFSPAYFLRALTSAGVTSLALLPNELRAKLITAAISVSDS